MSHLFQNFRYAFRRLRRSPVFTLTATLALTLGIGATTTIFTVVDCVLLRPLPYRDSNRLVRVYKDNSRLGRSGETVSPADFLDLRGEAHSFAKTTAVATWSFNLVGGEHAERIGAMLVTEDFFSVLQVKPSLGRPFTEEEYESPNNRALAMMKPAGLKKSGPVSIVLSHGLWKRRFGGDRAILGRILELDGVPGEVVGVMPDGFMSTPLVGEGPIDCWIPQTYREGRDSRLQYLHILALLNPHVSLQQAQAEMNVMARRSESKRPEEAEGWTLRVVSLQESVVGEIKRQSWILFAAVGFVLMIACANVANLLLVRAAGRRGEIALRACLGAGRRQLMETLVPEALLLAIMGGVAGMGAAVWGVRIIKVLASEKLPRLDEITLDWRIFAFTGIVSLLTALLCTLLPVLDFSRPHLATALKEGGTTSAGLHRRWMGRLLVIWQIGVTLVLLIGAGLLARSLLNLGALELGFNPENVLTFQLSRAWGPDFGMSDQRRLWRTVLERVQAVPGVLSAAIGNVPLRSGGVSDQIQSEGLSDALRVTVDASTPDYFSVLQVPLLKGRYFNRFDTAESIPVTVVNRAAAERIWAGQDPIGRTISMPLDGGKKRTVVGVVENVRETRLLAELSPEVYLPFDQSARLLPGTMLIRTREDSRDTAAAVKSTVWSVDRRLALVDVATMEQRLSGELGPWRFRLLLMGSFSAIAFALATLGTYGVMAYSTAQRNREIAIRMALGAHFSNVLRLLLRESLLLIFSGMGLGLLASVTVTPALEKMLFGVPRIDFVSYIAITITWGLAALVVCYLPARRASRLDPMAVLKYE